MKRRRVTGKKLKRVLRLHALGRSYYEIAGWTGVSPSTIAGLIFRDRRDRGVPVGSHETGSGKLREERETVWTPERRAKMRERMLALRGSGLDQFDRMRAEEEASAVRIDGTDLRLPTEMVPRYWEMRRRAEEEQRGRFDVVLPREELASAG